MVRDIITLENDEKGILSSKTNDVEDFDEIGNLLIDMYETMEANHALGLAANQVGENKAILVLRDGPAMINPEIVAASGKVTSRDEGCLSVPNKRFTIKRKRNIVVEYFDVHGKQNRWKSRTKMQAIAIQHEIDHLNGITVKDRS